MSYKEFRNILVLQEFGLDFFLGGGGGEVEVRARPYLV